MLERRLHLGVDQRVVLVVVLTALRVPGEHVRAAELAEHQRRHLAGVGTLLVRRDVLRAVREVEPVGVHQRLHAAKVGERRQHGDVGGRVVGLLEAERQLLGVRDGLEVGEVHLPVAGDQRLAAAVAGGTLRRHDQSSRAARAGSVLPSRYSRLAPPPVEMCENPSSGRPSLRTAAAESPPPTTVNASDAISASATARVPPANASNSNTPMGPFQNTVLASASREANSSRVRGPMSRPSRSAGIAVASTTSCGASAANSVAASTSTGSTSSTSRLAASSMKPRTWSSWSSWSSDRPTSWPWALRKVYAMPPPMSSRSTLPSRLAMTPSLSETFAPPSTTTYGRRGFSVSRLSTPTSV